ncbi:MAG: AMP-binding protein [Acidimicrobiia bacterium]
MTAESLSEGVLEGIGNARLVFGVGALPVAAAECLGDGRRYFSKSADSPGVAALMTNDRPTVELLLGAIEAGAQLISLPLPARSADPVEYLRFVRRACEAQGMNQIVARDDVAPLLEGTTLEVRPHSDLGSVPLAGPRESGFELIQYSSGSTDQPKAVKLTDRQLGANVAAIISAVQPEPGDKPVSWLPLSHDMGLIGMLLTSLASTRPSLARQGDIILLDPVDFLRNPSAWVSAISDCAATITAAPDFGYRLCAERDQRGALDLSRLRCAIVGGEMIRRSTLTGFSDRFGTAGFRPTAFCPAYGMAELGLAATMTPMGSQWREMTVATLPLAEQRLMPQGMDPAESREVTGLVSSGPAISGYEVRCDAESGAVGPVSVRGASIGVDGASGASFADPDGWLMTGDLGAIADGWLYVCGRGDDYVVARGRNIYAPAVEEAMGGIGAVRAGRTGVFGLPSGDWVVAAEPESSGRLAQSEVSALIREIRKAALSVAACSPSQVVLVARGHLPFTPSGKLQRRELTRRYLKGELEMVNGGS